MRYTVLSLRRRPTDAVTGEPATGLAVGSSAPHELAAAGDNAGAAVWRRMTDAVGRPENTTPPGPLL